MKKEKTTETKQRFSQLREIVENNLYSFSYVWKNSKAFFFISLLDIFSGLFSPLLLLLNRRIFNMLEAQGSFIIIAAIILSVMLIGAADNLWNRIYWQYIMPKFSQRLYIKTQEQFYEKAAEIDLSNYDDPQFYNNFITAMQYTGSCAVNAVSTVTNFIGCLVNISATLALLIYIDIPSILVLVASTVLSLIIGSAGKKLNFEMQKTYMSVSRKGIYIDKMYSLPDFAKEMRMSHIHENAKRDYDAYVEEHLDQMKKFGLKNSLLGIADNLNNSLGYIAVIALMVYKFVVAKTVTIGDFSVFVNANWSFRGQLNALGNLWTDLPAKSREISLVRKFLDYEPIQNKNAIEAPRFESLELRNVCFGYTPENEVLHGISMKLRRGEKIAIVGYNGAGKSTLISLIMRLYTPDGGAIIYNGKEVSEYDIHSYRKRIGAVFQDYRIFAATVAENVLADEFTENDELRVNAALRKATFDIKLSKMKNGINTMLTREFDEDGTNLSGGEAQKIAIARIFAGDHDIIIMDEPSASLDPIAEYELNRQISDFAKDKTVIFISHRLSTTRRADRIYMLENGYITEQGNHDELMNLGGKYAEMFTAQAENYIKNS